MAKIGNGVRKWKVRGREKKWVEYFIYSFYKSVGGKLCPRTSDSL